MSLEIEIISNIGIYYYIMSPTTQTDDHDHSAKSSNG